MTYTLKNQPVLRSASCPSSPPPSPDSPVVTERARPLTKVPFNLRRSSLTLATSPCPSPIQDKSYLEALGLRLNEAVSKALAHPSGSSLPSELLNGRRPIPAGRGRALGILIASYVGVCYSLLRLLIMVSSELQVARDNKSLYRAVLRALHKPLSVLLSDLSALLLPLLSSTAFLRPSAPTLTTSIPNATQLHAIAISDFAGELLSSFNDMALGLDTDSRSDGLKPIRAGLVSLIARVLTPLITGIKDTMIPLVDALENPAKTTSQKVHPSIVALQSLVPVYARALARYASTHPSHTLLASFLISIVWRALVALSHRPMVAQSSLQVVLTEKGQHVASPAVPSVAPTGLFKFKYGSSRPASPSTLSAAAADAKALCKILSHFPRPQTSVAKEAVDEAFVHLEALTSFLEVAEDPFFGVGKAVGEIADDIHDLTDELPTLIALPVLVNMRCFANIIDPKVRTVSAFVNVPEDVYRREYLAGFGRAEQYGPVVAQRILDEISTRPIVVHSECFVVWLKDRLGQIDIDPVGQ